MNELAQLLVNLEAGAAATFGDATIVRLLAPSSEGTVDADLLEEGVRDGRTVVREIGLEGIVNEVVVDHGGPKLLLLIDGEQLLGAKQNRIFNASFLVPPGASTHIPVSCVERGRWRYSTTSFDAAGSTIAPSLRASKLSRVGKSVREKRTYDADQGAVWRDVDSLLGKRRTLSPTSAYEDTVHRDRERIEHRLGDLAPSDRQVGVALVRGGRVELLELFGSPALFTRSWRKVARGVLVEIDGALSAPDERAPRAVQELLELLARAPQTRSRAPGAGETIHGEVDGRTVGAIAHDGCIYHLIAA